MDALYPIVFSLITIFIGVGFLYSSLIHVLNKNRMMYIPFVFHVISLISFVGSGIMYAYSDRSYSGGPNPLLIIFIISVIAVIITKQIMTD